MFLHVPVEFLLDQIDVDKNLDAFFLELRGEGSCSVMSLATWRYKALLESDDG